METHAHGHAGEISRRERRLGRSGLEVSDIGLGLWGMSGWTGSDEERSKRVLRSSVDLGCTFFDTAWAYGEGNSDRLLGELMADRPKSPIVAASKVPPLDRHWPALSTSSFGEVFPSVYVKEMVDKIRTALRVERVPLLQLHVWDDHWAGDPGFRSLVEELKVSGSIQYFGLSLNRWEPWNGLRAIETGLVDTVQVIYNIFDQSPEDELFPACARADVGVIARVPLDEGSLGGNLSAETRFPSEDWRSRYFGPENLPQTLRHVEAVREVLPVSMTLPEMALRFVLSDPRVSTTIVGVRTEEHLVDNLDAAKAGPLDARLIEVLRGMRWDRAPAPWSD